MVLISKVMTLLHLLWTVLFFENDVLEVTFGSIRSFVGETVDVFVGGWVGDAVGEVVGLFVGERVVGAFVVGGLVGFVTIVGDDVV